MKTFVHSDFRVEVRPRSGGDFGFASIGGMRLTWKEEEAACLEIADQIRRHVDGLPSGSFDRQRGVNVISEREAVCEHCNSEWTEDSREYNGGCCAKDQEAEDVREAART